MFAQYKPQVGDTITGVVFDDEGPLMMVYVTERDSTDRVVAYDLTVADGSFSFKLVNPKDRLVVNFVGYDKVDIPIDSTYFEIKMMDQGDTIIILDCNPNAPIPIPLRDSSDVFHEIDMSEFEAHGFTTIDEVLNAKFGPDFPFTVSDHVQVKTKHEYVDLGLSVKWATCNLGAEIPEEYGDYYAWGETTPICKYLDYDSTIYNTLKVSETIRSKYHTPGCRLEPDDDAAHVNWGGDWRMPTKEEFAELFEKCEWADTIQNDVFGFLFTSKVPGYTSESIFLPYNPAAINDIADLGAAMSYQDGHYMTSNISSQYASRCVILRFSAYEFGTFDDEIDLDIGWIDNRGILAGMKWSKIHITPFDMTGPALIRPVCP